MRKSVISLHHEIRHNNHIKAITITAGHLGHFSMTEIKHFLYIKLSTLKG